MMLIRMMRVVPLLWLLLSSFAIETATAQTTTPTTTSCNLCRGGEPILFPDKSISIPGFPFLDTCGSLGAVLPFLGPDSTECGLLQSLGTLCGCPMQPDACQLCREEEEEEDAAEEAEMNDTNGSSNSTTIPTPESVLSNPQGDLPFLSFLFGGVVPTCELYEAYLHNFNDTTSDCIVGQEFLSQYCGCPSSSSSSSSSSDIPSTPAMNSNDNDSANTAPTPCNLCPSGANMTTPNANISIPGFPFRTCHELNDAVIFLTDEGSPQCDLVQSISSLCGCPPPKDEQEERCTLCEDGSSAPFPDKPVRWATGAFLGVTPTCALYEAYVNGLSQDDTSCSLAQTLGPHCGCAPSVQDHCVFCEGGFPEESLQNDMYIIDTDEENTGIAPTCELFETFQYSLRPRDGFCMVGQYLGYVCGCNGGRAKYYGADQQWQKILLVWLQRVSGILSFIGATCIQVDVIRDKRRRSRLYNQLVFAMSIFDDMTALALMVGPAAIPTIHDFYGVAGNDLSCQIQGFFVQAGVISIFYNVTLTFYYKLSIVDGWREDRLKSWRLAFHGIPLAIGFGYAFAGIPYYDQTPLFCHLNTFPLVDEWETVLVFGYIPVSTAIVVLSSMMIYILVRIRSQQKKGARWSTKNAARSSDGSSQKRSVLDSMLRRRRTDEATVHRIRNKLVEQVYWQAFSYLLCFYITWPIIHAAEVYGGLVVGGGWFWFWCLVAWASPLQGMSNALVYFRPRWQRARSQKQRERERRRRRLAGQEQPDQNHRHKQQMIPLYKRLWNFLQCQRKEAYLDSKVLSTANTVSVASLPTNNNNNNNSQSEEQQPDGTMMMMMDSENTTNYDDSATSLDFDDNADDDDDDMSNSSLLYEPSAAVAAEDLLERLICDEIRNNPQQQQQRQQEQEQRRGTPFVRRMSTEEGFLEDIDEGSQEDADDDDDEDDNTNKQVSGSSSQEKPKQRRASWGGFFFRSGSSGDIDETWKNNKSDRDLSLFELRRKTSPSPGLSNDNGNNSVDNNSKKKKKKKKRRATWSPLDWFSSPQDDDDSNNNNAVRYQSRYEVDMFLLDPASPEDFSPPPLPEGGNPILGSATLRHSHSRSVLLHQHSSTLGSIKEGGEGEESSSSCCSSLEFSPVSSRRDRVHHHHYHNNNDGENDNDNNDNTIPNHHTALVEHGKLPFDGHGKPNF